MAANILVHGLGSDLWGFTTGDEPGVFFTDPGAGDGIGIAANTGDLFDVWPVDISRASNPGFPAFDQAAAALLDHMTRVISQQRQTLLKNGSRQLRLVALHG